MFKQTHLGDQHWPSPNSNASQNHHLRRVGIRQLVMPSLPCFN